MSKYITIVVEGGCVVDVLDLPKGWFYTIKDYDAEGTTEVAEDADELCCGNCDEPFYVTEGNEAHATGFCSAHCLNQHRGDECEPPCQYCKDNVG